MATGVGGARLATDDAVAVGSALTTSESVGVGWELDAIGVAHATRERPKSIATAARRHSADRICRIMTP